MANPKISITVEINDKGSDAAFARMKARFEQLEDVSDKAVSEIGKSLNEKLAGGFASGGEREYLETIRRMQPALKQLHENIKSGAFDLADYQRRIQLLDPATRSAVAAANQLGTAFNRVGQEAEHGTNGLGNLLIKLDLLGRGVNFVQQKFGEATQEFIQFGRNVANIGSITDDSFDLGKIKKDLIDLPPELGKTSEAARGMYQAISSGVDASKALQFTRDSAVAAKAGVASLFETVDASTSVLNSYGIAAENVNHIYSAMFQTVRDGKIEMPQLASYIGNLSNVSASAGVKIEEMFAVIATATATTKPAIAIEAFRSALSSVIKPSSEAAQLAQQLGLEFNVSAIRAKGFAAFLADVMEKTHGNTEQLATLFGNVEGLNSILSITGAQAGTFSKEIRSMTDAYASGDAHIKGFAKQQESLGAQLDATGVLIEKGFLAVVSRIEPILVFILSLINKYPAPFAIAATAVGALTAAHLLYNTQLILSASVAIPNLIKSIGNTVVVMYEMTMALISGNVAMSTFSTTALVAFTAGWGLVAAAIGVAIYAIANMETAADKANKVTLESINANAQSLQSYQALNVEVANVAAAQEGSTERHEKLNAVLGRLDPATQAYINSLKDEKQQITAVTAEIDRNINARRAAMEAQLRVAAEGIIAQESQIKSEIQSIEKWQSSIREVEALKSKPANLLTANELETLAQVKDRTLLWSQAIVDAQGRVDELSVKLGENQIKLIQAGKGLDYNNDGLREFFINGGKTAGQVDLLTTIFGRATNAQNNFAKGLTDTGDATKTLTKDVFNLRQELNKLTSASQENIDRKILDIVTNAKDKADALARAKQARIELKPDIDNIRQHTEKFKAVDSILNPTEKSSSRTGETRAQHRAETDAARTLADRQLANFNSAMRRLDDGMRRMIEEYADKYRISRQLAFAQIYSESSFKTKARSPFNENVGDYAFGLTQQLPATASRVLHRKVTGSELQKNPRTALSAWGEYMTQLFNEFGDWNLAVLAYHQGEGTVRKLVAAMNQGKTGQGIIGKKGKAYAEQISTLSGVSGNQRFDYGRSLQEQSDALTQAERDSQTRSLIEAARTTRLKPATDVISDFNKILVEEAKKAGGLQPTLEKTAAEFKNFSSLSDNLPDGFLQPRALQGRDKHFKDLSDSLKLTERQKELDERRLYLADEINIRAVDYRLGLQEQMTETQVEFGLLQLRNVAIEASVEFEKQRNTQIREIGDIERDLIVLRAQNADDQFVEQRRLLSAKKEQLSLEQEIANLQDEIFNQGINDSLKIEAAFLRDVVDLRNREITAVIAANRAELELSQSMKISNNEIRARVLENLASQKTLNESIADGINSVYDAIGKKLDENIDKAFKWAGVFKSLFTEPIKAMARNSLTTITRGLLDAVFPGLGTEITKTNNPVARPIVDEIGKSNKLLETIARNTGGAKLGIGGSSGTRSGLSAIFGNLVGGGSQSGSSSVGFNLGALLGGGSGSSIYGAGDRVIMNPNGTLSIQRTAQSITGDGNNSIFSNLKNLFSTREGGLFAARGNMLNGGNTSALAGKIGGIGDIAAMVGGMIGGKFGNVLSMAGTGASIGANFGPWGAAIGAGVGALIGLFGGDPKRKADKNQLPQLQQLFTDDLAKLRELAANRNAILQNPDGVISQANELKAHIAAGGGLTWQSKKYQKQAQQQIAQKLVEADAIIAQIKEFAKKAYSAKDLEGHIIGEFASGNFFTGRDNQMRDMRRMLLDTRRGFIDGGQLGVDRHLGLFADGEIIANKQHQQNIINAAGFDVFAYAGIPNYPKAPTVRGYADGNYFGSVAPTVTTASNPVSTAGDKIINVTVNLYKDEQGNWQKETESDNGQKVIAKIVEKKYANGELRLQKR